MPAWVGKHGASWLATTATSLRATSWEDTNATPLPTLVHANGQPPESSNFASTLSLARPTSFLHLHYSIPYRGNPANFTTSSFLSFVAKEIFRRSQTPSYSAAGHLPPSLYRCGLASTSHLFATSRVISRCPLSQCHIGQRIQLGSHSLNSPHSISTSAVSRTAPTYRRRCHHQRCRRRRKRLHGSRPRTIGLMAQSVRIEPMVSILVLTTLRSMPR